ncbi:hypothetical protein HPP05_21260 [Corallococcus exiguus]|uniref:Ig-like domain-containing protein n=1 Tax=Corallococcus exiguus TaxID=83462 RepID=UPI0014945079|nr:Ig-like domain-containing protein [Corallococcus exiguus]NPC72288.1 hypothetical protein [Corallococcus exiguus]
MLKQSLKRSWLPALVTTVFVTVGTGCGDECVDQFDCRDKGAPPAGQAYTCVENKCELRTLNLPPEEDAGTETDAGTTTDAGTDAGTTTSAQIAAFIAAPAGALATPQPVSGAFVTFIKPEVTGSSSTEASGFFLQADANGPAMFVRGSASTTAVAVGDLVTLNVTEKEIISGLNVAKTVTDLTVVSKNNNVSNLATETPPGLKVDISGESSFEDGGTTGIYESRLVTVSGKLEAGISSGASFTAFPLITTGEQSPSPLRLRLPTTLSTDLDLVLGCDVAVPTGVVWRFNAQPQVSVFAPEQLTINSCPAPAALAAIAPSNTQLRMTFDRRIAPTSITDVSTQFTFDNGLQAQSATVNGKDVMVTTSEQSSGTQYTVQVSGVTDTLGKAIVTPNSTQFQGFSLLAVHGGRVVLTGAGFTGATEVTIGGVAQTFTVDSDTQITVTNVPDTTPVGASQPVQVTTPAGAVSAGALPVAHLVINELDSDTPSTDVLEFVEISTGVPNLSVSGFSMVLFNGSNDQSYLAVDISGKADANGLLLVGNSGVTPAPAVIIPNETLQNGADAVGLYQAPASAFPNGTVPTTTNLIDVIVYDTNDADDAGLLDALLGTGPERVQIDETGTSGGSAANSIQRCGVARKDGRVFSRVAAPTPGAPNACP